ncbi:MAG: biliverdin-producing heme oxygenase [Rhodopila sp.]|jgi:heme oxygenase
MMPVPISRLAQLRAGTQAAHSRIETAPALVRLVARDLTRGEYVFILQHLQALYTHLEPAVAAELETLPAAAALLDGSRPRRLAEDLAWFGASALPPPPLPVLAGPAAALGALYVIEGSGLGGRIIGRNVAECLGVAPGAGGSFFCGLDAESARVRWSRLSSILDESLIEADSADAGTDADDRVVAGARDTFGFFERCFRRIEVADQSGNVMADAVAS